MIREIEWLNLLPGYGLALLPLIAFYFLGTGLVRPFLIATVRMTLQLILVGFYLQFLFEINLSSVNLLWVLGMILIATPTIIHRAGLNLRQLFFPVFFSVLAGLFVADSVFLLGVLQLDNPFDARYLIPISGMILGNSLTESVLGMRLFYQNLGSQRELHEFYLASGASKKEAMIPFLSRSLEDSFQPGIARMANIGLISLPGMMTGQLLGGSSPETAVRYQIIILLSIHAGSLITVLLTTILSAALTFSPSGLPSDSLYRKKNGRSIF